MVWQRLILPDGASLLIDNLPATDAAGYTDLQSKVDYQTWQLLKGVGLSTLLGVGTQLSMDDESDLVRALADYTALYNETYDSKIEGHDQIPSMLENFLASDKAFTKGVNRKP